MADFRRSSLASPQGQNFNRTISGKRGKACLLNEKHPLMLSASVSAQDLRALDGEKFGAEPSPRAVLKDFIKSRDIETEVLETSCSEASTNPMHAHSQGRRFLQLLKKKSLKRLPTIPPVSVPTLSRKFRSSREARSPGTAHAPADPELLCFIKPSWKNFSIAELKEATNNFNPKNIIGKGGYAEVYKGKFQDGKYVAIKRLTKGTIEEMTHDFLSEIGIIVHVSHPNAAKLIGYGVEEGMHLVLQLSSHGSLAELLTSSKEKLDWNTRYKIALGTAEGLHYLHERCPRRVIHRDIKAGNILLRDDFEPQICDFGLAKWLPDQLTHHTVSKFEGTFGYIAPECFLHGIVDEKTDVYAFGVVLLELVTGRLAIDSSQRSLVMWAKPLLEKSQLNQLVDPSLREEYNHLEINYVLDTASACIRHSSILRPRMGQVIELLRGEGEFEILTPRRTWGLQRVHSEETLDADEYNSTRYLSDLARLRHVALES